MIYKTITTEVEVDVHLSDFDTDDLVEELEGRGRVVPIGIEDNETLMKIWQHDREGRKEEAYELMRWSVLEKLGKVV